MHKASHKLHHFKPAFRKQLCNRKVLQVFEPEFPRRRPGRKNNDDEETSQSSANEVAEDGPYILLDADHDLAASDSQSPPVTVMTMKATATRHLGLPAAPASAPKKQKAKHGVTMVLDAINALLEESKRARLVKEAGQLTRVEQAIDLVQERRWLSAEGLLALEDVFVAQEKRAGIFLLYSEETQLAWLKRQLPGFDINEQQP